jgi:hypothetical protein
MKRSPWGAALGATLLMLASACATGPRVHTHMDPTVQLTNYRTYGFVPEPGTNRAGYSTFVTNYFKEAIRREMDARGYTYDESNPDLLVNFNANAREVTEVRSTPGAGPAFGYGLGYYGYRGGLYMYGPWYPFYGRDIDTVRYNIGTANVDVVDARRKEMVWEGVVEGRLSSAAMREPQQAISDAVANMFQKFPARSGGAG